MSMLHLSCSVTIIMLFNTILFFVMILPTPFFFFFFFNDPAPTEISPFPLHAALPIGWRRLCPCDRRTVFQHDDGDDDACKSKDLCNAPGQLVPLLVFFDEPSLSDRGQAIFAREY